MLKDPATRAEYDTRPHSAASGCAAPSYQVVAPPFNRVFLTELMTKQGTVKYHIGDYKLYDYLEAVLNHTAVKDTYHECKVAARFSLGLRVVATGARDLMPIYPQPRVIRHAAFMNMPVLELDVPSSHGQQALRYCRRHCLPESILRKPFPVQRASPRSAQSSALPWLSMLSTCWLAVLAW